jgi:hypothetical protein
MAERGLSTGRRGNTRDRRGALKPNSETIEHLHSSSPRYKMLGLKSADKIFILHEYILNKIFVLCLKLQVHEGTRRDNKPCPLWAVSVAANSALLLRLLCCHGNHFG